VSKIANVDFPDQWPALLPTLLQVIPNGPDAQLHGALKVLLDLVDDSLSDDQFFSVARDIITAAYGVAINDSRRGFLRALAISVFRSCFDIMDIVKDEHGQEVKGFAEETLKSWMPFFLEVVKSPLPAPVKGGDEGYESGRGDQPEQYQGLVAVKVQVVKTLMKIRSVFPHILLPETPTLFSIIWGDLSAIQAPYKESYIDSEEQARLEDADGLPYTLDFLVLEELDFLQSCLRAPPVQKELEAQLQANGGVHATPWVMDVMKLAVGYAQIPTEEEALWDIDVNLFLAEETSVTANYTARTACGDMLIKLGEWLHQGALEGLLAYSQTLFASEGTPWRTQEAALYLVTQLLNDFLDVDKQVSPEVAGSYLGLIDYAINRPEEQLLRARGYLVAGILVQSLPEVPQVLLDRTVKGVNGDNSEVVNVSCIKSIQGFIKANSVSSDKQIGIVDTISEFLNSRDLTDLEDADDLLVTLVETLRAAIGLDPMIAIAGDRGALDLLFVLAKHGASNFQLTMLVSEAFEDIVEALAGPDTYTPLCEKVLPSLTGALDVGNVTQDDPLIKVSASHIVIPTC
jgi:hypothetical protein